MTTWALACNNININYTGVTLHLYFIGRLFKLVVVAGKTSSEHVIRTVHNATSPYAFRTNPHMFIQYTFQILKT